MANEIERVAGSVERLYSSGALSDESIKALEAPSVALDIAQGLGERGSSSELLLASVLVDDSTSIAANINEIRIGYGLMLEALRSQSSTADVQVHTRALNRGVISPYRRLANATPLTEQNYSGSRLAPRTPLYRQSLLTLGTVMAKAQEEEDRGAKVRTFTLIITDAEDNSSGGITVKHIRAMVADMLEFATNHIVAGMGVGERKAADFRQIFLGMGIPREWIFTAGSSVKELEDVFGKITKKLRLAASSEAEFLQLAAGELA